MALYFDDSNLEVIAFVDDALNHDLVTREVYESYLEDLDLNKLTFLPEKQPTKFLMKRVIDYKTQKNIKREQFKFESTDVNDLKSGKANIQIDMIGAPSEYVRAAIVDIKHPDNVLPGKLAFRKGPDGLLHEEIMALLETYGVVADLYKAWDNQVNKKNMAPKKS